MTITWTIENMDRRISDGFVTTAHWRATAVDGDITVTAYGSCGFGQGEPVVPYADLTEESVLGWCFENGVDKAEIEANLTSQINSQKNPVSASGTPWSAVEVSAEA